MKKRRIISRTNNIDRGALSKALVTVFIIVLIAFASFYFNSSNVSAQNSSNRNKQVVSIKIEAGDTLWGIAKEYMTEEYNDINEYIEEIKTSNGLFEDTIHEGHYLIVPYYADNDCVSSSDTTRISSAVN